VESPEVHGRACLPVTEAISAPILDQGDRETLDKPQAPEPWGELSLLGPSDRSDRAHLPVRGDLAHIRLAGRYFVPHYVVPMSHRVTLPGTPLTATGKDGTAILAMLEGGTVFEVLDIAGGWAWGQVGVDGLTGYVAMTRLEPV
jgi:Bacterial dipeptidyl-peptidase Sh3 domain